MGFRFTCNDFIFSVFKRNSYSKNENKTAEFHDTSNHLEYPLLDPFAGSGTTVLAAVLEGYAATGIKASETYATLARERIHRALST